MTAFYHPMAWTGQKTKPLLNTALRSLLLLVFAIPATATSKTPAEAASTSEARVLLQASTAEYRVEAKGLTTKARRELRPLKDGQWRLDIETRLLFFRFSETSQFRVTDELVVPLEYSREQGSRKRNQKLVFDWQAGYANNRIKGYEWQSSLSQGLLDRFSQQAQLRVDMITGRLNETREYRVLDKERIKTYAVKQVGKEQLTLDDGTTVETVVLEQSRVDGDRVTRIWLAPKWNYLLIKLHQNDEGEESLLTLLEARVNGESLQ